ncbi:MAG: hypothetical protein IJ572_05950 [Bacilli bacterium]|nr:hypothetical protein [Bacilli bacterium]
MKKNKIISIFLITLLIISFCSDLITYSYALNQNQESIEIIKSNGNITEKIGMNGHVDVPRDILLAGSVVREYHNFGWSITENKQMFFERFSWWDFDGYYKFLHDNNITILPCIQMGEQAVFNRNRNEKPVMKGDDTTDPLSYKIHSNYLFNYAARYGSTKVDTSLLNLDPKDSIKTGLGYITYYEDWNEPDKTWQGPDAQFNSTELAAMLSADYDGHEGKLGKTYGVKQADPNAKLVMGGMAGGSYMVKWLSEMQEWANKNRTDKKLPLDVINYHQYGGTHSPENTTFVEDAKKIMAWRDENAKDKEIWITEFGWDTNPGSTKHAAPSEDAQRDWIIREYLIGDRIGLDKMTVYDALNDGPSSDATQYSTSGLATKVSEGTVKKSSWYGVNTLKNTLKGYHLSEIIKEDNQMYIYKYINGNDICYVLWSPTENNTVISNYALNIGKYKNATLTQLKDKEALGLTSDLPINNNQVTVNVSESPIFIKVSGKIKEETKQENKEQDDDKKQEDNKTVVDDKKQDDNKTVVDDKNQEDNKTVVDDKNQEEEIIKNDTNKQGNNIDETNKDKEIKNNDNVKKEINNNKEVIKKDNNKPTNNQTNTDNIKNIEKDTGINNNDNYEQTNINNNETDEYKSNNYQENKIKNTSLDPSLIVDNSIKNNTTKMDSFLAIKYILLSLLIIVFVFPGDILIIKK